jgi:hypothetical protein
MANVGLGAVKCPSGSWTWLNGGVVFTPFPWVSVDTRGFTAGTLIAIQVRVYLSSYPYYFPWTGSVSATPPALSQTFNFGPVTPFEVVNLQVNPSVTCNVNWLG